METKKEPNLLKAALKYHAAGYKVIFTNEDKRPEVGSWAKYRTSQTAEEINAMYEANKAKIKGLAVLCTDGMEVIDIDQKYSLDGQLMADYLSQVSEAIGQDDFFNKVTISMTVSGGAHVIYKTELQEGNQKLASRATTETEEGNNRVLLETRGKGGYIIVPPTEGYKFDVFNDTLAPTISNDWRNILINTARTFDEVSNNFTAKNAQSTPIEVQGPHLSTIDAFNEAHTPYELLIGAGWKYLFTKGGNDHLTRPGKRSGTSAGYNEAQNLVYIFTSSTEFENERAYNAFQVYTVLNHGGDYKEAARALYRNGYGDRMTVTRDSSKVKQQAVLHGETRENAVAKSLMEQIFDTRFDVNKVPKHIDYVLTYKAPSRTKPFNIAAYGDIVTICGKQKSRKTSLASSVVAGALSFTPPEILRFTLQNNKRKFVYLDTEQTEAENFKVQKRMKAQAGVPINENQDHYYNWCIAGYSTLERVAFAIWVIEEKLTDIGVLYIDGLVDLAQNYNDLPESQALVGKLKYLAVKHNILVVVLLHDAKTTGQLRGHLGTELLNKSKAIIRVTKDSEGGFSTVNFADLREEEPNDFDFTHDANGNLVET